MGGSSMTTLRDLLNDLLTDYDKKDAERAPGREAKDDMKAALLDEYIEAIKTRLIG